MTIKTNYLALCIHTVLLDGTYTTQVTTRKTLCMTHSKEKRYEMIKSICETSEANQKLIAEGLEHTLEDTLEGELVW